MAYCGMAAALSIAFMLLGAVIPILMYHRARHCQLPGGDGLRGVRQDPGLDSLWGRQPAEPAVCAGQRGGADIRFFAGVLPAGQSRNSSTSGLLCCGGCLQTAALQRRHPARCTGWCCCSSPAAASSQEMRTTALAVSLTTLAMGNVAFLLYDRALHNMLMLKVVWQPQAPQNAGQSIDERDFVTQYPTFSVGF